MECKARIITAARGMDGGFTLTLALEGATRAEIEKMQDMDLTATFKKYYAKRGKDANAYFHVLVHKIAEAMQRSDAYIKNDLIEQAGFIEYLDTDAPATITTNIEPEQMKEQEILHTRLDRIDVQDGQVIYKYTVMRGSHTYDTKEMSRLIDLTVQQAKDLDIETLPPDEIKRLTQEWEQVQARRKKLEAK